MTGENCLICLLIHHQLYAGSFVHLYSVPTPGAATHYHMQQPELYELHSSLRDHLLHI